MAADAAARAFAGRTGGSARGAHATPSAMAGATLRPQRRPGAGSTARTKPVPEGLHQAPDSAPPAPAPRSPAHAVQPHHGGHGAHRHPGEQPQQRRELRVASAQLSPPGPAEANRASWIPPEGRTCSRQLSKCLDGRGLVAQVRPQPLPAHLLVHPLFSRKGLAVFHRSRSGSKAGVSTFSRVFGRTS